MGTQTWIKFFHSFGVDYSLGKGGGIFMAQFCFHIKENYRIVVGLIYSHFSLHFRGPGLIWTKHGPKPNLVKFSFFECEKSHATSLLQWIIRPQKLNFACSSKKPKTSAEIRHYEFSKLENFVIFLSSVVSIKYPKIN